MRDTKWRLMLALFAFLLALLPGTAYTQTQLPALSELEEDEQLLVWWAPVTSPNEAFNGREYGEIATLSANGLITLNTITDPINQVISCGQNAAAPDGRSFAYFLGHRQQNRGALYLFTPDGEAHLVDETMQLLACIGGNGRFMYSPDGSRFAYLDYPSNSTSREFASGTLAIYDLDELGEEAFFGGDVVSFELTNEGAVFLTFSNNAAGNTTEAVVNWWDTTTDREVLSLSAEQGCRYTTGYIQEALGSYWMILVENCLGEVAWQIYRINPDGSNALQVLSERPAGSMFSYSETNNLWFSESDEMLFYSQPDGTFSYTARIFGLALADLSDPHTLIERAAIMPTMTASENSHSIPKLSPDGHWLAVVTSTGQQANTLQIIDLQNVAAPVRIFEVETGGDIIPFMEFTPQGDKLIYIAGASSPGDNTVYSIDLNELNTASRVRRGRFTRWGVLSPDGTKLAVLEWQDPPQDLAGATDYLSLMEVNLEDGSIRPMFEGLVEAAGDFSYRFALPLYWKPGS
jgi:Tol biopolymer transport system component